MTSRERIESTLRHKNPDRTPIFEYVLLSPIADKLLGRPYAGDPNHWEKIIKEKGWKSAVYQKAVDHIDLAVLLGYDMLYITPNPPLHQEEKQKQLSENNYDDDPVERIRIQNMKKMQKPLKISDEKLLIYEFLKKEMKHRGLDFPILAPAYAHGIWTDVNLMQTMLLAPDVAHQHFSLATKSTQILIEKYIEYGIDQIGIGGDFAGNRPLISPECYRTFIVPELKQLSEQIHSAGMWAINTSDGNLWSVIEDFLISTDVDGYLEIDFQAGMDLRKLKKLYGDKITFFGNLDCGNILSFGSIEKVIQHTIECIEAGLGNGGHILCAGNAITSSVPFENFCAVVNAYRNFFGMSKLSLV